MQFKLLLLLSIYGIKLKLELATISITNNGILLENVFSLFKIYNDEEVESKNKHIIFFISVELLLFSVFILLETSKSYTHINNLLSIFNSSDCPDDRT